jgi:hypothetical protein
MTHDASLIKRLEQIQCLLFAPTPSSFRVDVKNFHLIRNFSLCRFSLAVWPVSPRDG